VLRTANRSTEFADGILPWRSKQQYRSLCFDEYDGPRASHPHVMFSSISRVLEVFRPPGTRICLTSRAASSPLPQSAFPGCLRRANNVRPRRTRRASIHATQPRSNQAEWYPAFIRSSRPLTILRTTRRVDTNRAPPPNAAANRVRPQGKGLERINQQCVRVGPSHPAMEPSIKWRPLFPTRHVAAHGDHPGLKRPIFSMRRLSPSD